MKTTLQLKVDTASLVRLQITTITITIQFTDQILAVFDLAICIYGSNPPQSADLSLIADRLPPAYCVPGMIQVKYEQSKRKMFA